MKVKVGTILLGVVLVAFLSYTGYYFIQSTISLGWGIFSFLDMTKNDIPARDRGSVVAWLYMIFSLIVLIGIRFIKYISDIQLDI